ncbi:putative MFS-type transporter [Colletotrichum fructicola]|uniref:Efflux pump antibiotic resistance protein n=1 Tax=Colletotrichum fructicola (strain Nara gc5) TaxID=1213859 RepID=L2GBW8_COLFN|nr:putative MFS-type transporter [Colletotrichum fructicola]KAF4482524.1 putative MFS-type transporter [Colletotrichum fructicola Nara gc5]KAF4883607.1 putative MFS-type transporter [Colletotrichum fructicola]KAF4889331.1 putative MFS-type transporter [Colletotrichum fructicola]KAF4938907.1 putative MFS-type transporter [Colletotrichum fructicola]
MADNNERKSATTRPHGNYSESVSKADGKWRKAAASACIILCQFIQTIPLGAGINGGLNMAQELGVSPAFAIWIIASYPLTQGTFVLMGGRVGAVYGHKKTAAAGGILWVIFHLISGFMRSITSLSIMRALSGVGAAFVFPNAVALLTITNPPGKARNISVGLFGAMAPIGAAGGSVFPALFGQLTQWWWLFFFLALLGSVIFGLFIIIVPGEPTPMDPLGKVDYIGAYLGVCGLILFNFVWTQSALVGWSVPYIYAVLIASILHVAGFVIWEVRFAAEPIMPMNIWGSPSFNMMIASSFVSFMGFGMLIWYLTAWQAELRGYTMLLNAATYAPLAVGGAGAALLSAKVVRHLAAQYILAIGSTATLVSLLLVATMPVQQTYWAQAFPAILLGSLGPDFVFTASQLIASGTVRRDQQGLAGSLIGTILSYGLATGLGFAGTVERYTNNDGKDLARGYRNGLYLGVGMAGVAAVMSLAFVRIPRDRREGWGEQQIVAEVNLPRSEP